jgi:hypothetical protein
VLGGHGGRVGGRRNSEPRHRRKSQELTSVHRRLLRAYVFERSRTVKDLAGTEVTVELDRLRKQIVERGRGEGPVGNLGGLYVGLYEVSGVRSHRGGVTARVRPNANRAILPTWSLPGGREWGDAVAALRTPRPTGAVPPHWVIPAPPEPGVEPLRDG